MSAEALPDDVSSAVSRATRRPRPATDDLPERQRRTIMVRAAAILLIDIASAVLILIAW